MPFSALRSKLMDNSTESKPRESKGGPPAQASPKAPQKEKTEVLKDSFAIVSHGESPDRKALVAPEAWGMGTGFGEPITSLDLKTPEGRAALLHIIDGEVPGLEEVLNTVLEVTGFTAHPVKFEDDQSGELVTAVRTVLHIADGSFRKAVSIGVWKSLQLIQAVHGYPAWDPPLMIRPRRVAGRKGRSRYRLEVV
jgi:Phage Single-stranded DNA-binding protein